MQMPGGFALFAAGMGAPGEVTAQRRMNSSVLPLAIMV